ncbi:MAG: hypothetical protein RR628_01100 [Clostridium sp.]|uniref:hypothetical protein n=1 Tax=Clostridium sp. TaxID=1506 RepID=UPI002FCBDB7E
MRRKKRMRLIILFLVVSSFLTIIGLININIINTKALSPIGNTYDNFKLVSSEFGEDFNGFIQDNSNVKIYEDEGEYIVSVNDKKIKVKEESNLLNGIKNIFRNTFEAFSKLFSTIEEFITKII